jgi:hypothetical protein
MERRMESEVCITLQFKDLVVEQVVVVVGNPDPGSLVDFMICLKTLWSRTDLKVAKF